MVFVSFIIKKKIDRDRTRTCNPQIRSLMPYPFATRPQLLLIKQNYEHDFL